MAALAHLPDLHDPVGLRVRQRSQEHAVDDTEDRRRRANAKSQRCDDNDEKAWRADDRARRESKIAEKVFHGDYGCTVRCVEVSSGSYAKPSRWFFDIRSCFECLIR